MFTRALVGPHAARSEVKNQHTKATALDLDHSRQMQHDIVQTIEKSKSGRLIYVLDEWSGEAVDWIAVHWSSKADILCNRPP